MFLTLYPETPDLAHSRQLFAKKISKDACFVLGKSSFPGTLSYISRMPYG